MAKPIGPKFFVGDQGLQGRFMNHQNFKYLSPSKFDCRFFKIMKIREFFCENPRIIFVLFYDVHKENMFTINLGDGREAPSKARKKGAKRLEFLVM